MRNIATKLNKEVAQQKKANEMQKKMVAQLTAQKQALASSKNAQAATERDQLKEKMAKVEKDLSSAKTELEGANERNTKLRDRLRQFQKMIKDLREKEKTLEGQLAEANAGGTASVSASTPAPAATTFLQQTTTAQKDAKDAKDQETKVDPEPEQPASVKATQEVLKLPTGGFKFGPSEGSRPGKDATSTLSAAAPVFQPTSPPTTSVPTVAATTAKPTQATTSPAVAPAPSTGATSPKPASPKPAASPVAAEAANMSPRRNSGMKQDAGKKGHRLRPPILKEKI